MKKSTEQGNKDNIRNKLKNRLKFKKPEHFALKKPSNITHEYIKSLKPAGLTENFWFSGAQYIIHAIITQYEQKKYSYSHSGRGTYVSLCSDRLEIVVGKRYKRIIEVLVKHKIIESDTDPIPGVKCIGYRLTKKYRSQPSELGNVSTPGLTERLTKYKKQQLTKQHKALYKILHLVKWLQEASKLKLPSLMAWKTLDLYRDNEWARICQMKPSSLEELTSELRDRLDQAYDDMHSIDTEEVLLKPKFAKGRLFTPLTNLMKILRPFLTFDDSPMVSLDLKNSQPLHFLLVFTDEFWKKNEPWSLSSLNQTLYERIEEQVKNNKDTKEIITSKKPSLFFMSPMESEKPPQRPKAQLLNPAPSVSLFSDFVKNGVLYEHLTERYSGKFFDNHGYDLFASREKSKTSFFHMMYHNNRISHSSIKKAYQQFSEDFPHEAAMMDLLKSRFYKDFPELLQKIEGHFLLNVVTKVITKEIPEAPLFTIHDSVLTTQEHANKVEEIMKREYTKIFGFTPEIAKEGSRFPAEQRDTIKYVDRKHEEHFSEKLDKAITEEINSSTYAQTQISSHYIGAIQNNDFSEYKNDPAGKREQDEYFEKANSGGFKIVPLPPELALTVFERNKIREEEHTKGT
ncbi:hypothetical protein [Owenweeksia hongkongensis]|uniref:hypothetical protein n=1 Tax=Owenweeksia hongkongensis TaxID=253245 RepID=UPI003A8CA4F8